MSPETLREALKVVAGFPRAPQVHLTGGEPFLHFELLLQGARLATELGIPCYVETSASWCIDETQAVERLRALREAGLQAVLISCSPFHAERIPPRRTMRAIYAALKVFGPARVTVYLPDFIELVRGFGVERTTPLSRYEEEFGPTRAAQILWGGYGIISGGRAGYRLGHLVPHHPAETWSRENCAGEILYAQHSHLDLYGNYISGFCGGLTVGDWRDLPRLLDDRQRYPPLVQVLIERGPCGLYEYARETFVYQALPNGYTGKCHLCVDVRRRLVEMDDYEELRPREFYENI
jgi:hypothetical protein